MFGEGIWKFFVPLLQLFCKSKIMSVEKVSVVGEFTNYWLCFRSAVWAVGCSFANSVFRNPVGLLCTAIQFKFEQLYSGEKSNLKYWCYKSKLFLWGACVCMQSLRLSRKRDTVDAWHLQIE